MTRLLILAGTAEAVELATAAAARPGLQVVGSLAGRTRHPAALAGTQRTGGFGGAGGLEDYLRAEKIDLVIDATHPFAVAISENAVAASAAAGVPMAALCRPAWAEVAGDDWIEADDLGRAAALAGARGGRAFLAVGAQGLTHFAAARTLWRLARMVDPPSGRPGCEEVVVGKGPFSEADERELLAHHRIDFIVSRNSGGAGAYGKIAAARALSLPVIMVRRPPPPGPALARVADALAWLDAQLEPS